MKKVPYFITVIAVSVALFACGNKKPDPGPTPEDTFKVTWDLGVQQIVEEYKKGETPKFDYNKYPLPITNVGEIFNESTEQYADCFVKWDKDIVPVYKDTTYTAVFGERSVVTRILVDSPNNSFDITFKCEKQPTLVNWSDGDPEKPTSNELTHTYDSSFAGKTIFIYVFGDIGSITFASEEGALLASNNKRIIDVFLSPYVTSISTSAFPIIFLEGLFIPYSVKNMDENICLGKAYQDRAKQDTLMIFVEIDDVRSNWNPNWNKYASSQNYNVIYSVSDVGYGYDERNLNNMYMVAKYGGEEHVALTKNFGSTGEYQFPSTVKTNFGERYYTDILFGAFQNSTITDIKFDEDCEVTYIGSNAFSGSKIVDFKAPKKLISISEGAFAGINTLEIVTLSESIEEIGHDVFNSCSKLSKITFGNESVLNNTARFPDTLKTIDSLAFYNSGLLKTFIIPKSVIKLGNSAFQTFTNDTILDVSAYDSAELIPDVEKGFIAATQKITIKYNNNLSVDDFYNHNWPKAEEDRITYTPA